MLGKRGSLISAFFCQIRAVSGTPVFSLKFHSGKCSLYSFSALLILYSFLIQWNSPRLYGDHAGECPPARFGKMAFFRFLTYKKMDLQHLLDLVNSTSFIEAVTGKLTNFIALSDLMLTNDNPLIPDPESCDVPIIL